MVYDWLGDVPENVGECDYVEVQFKNTRKGYYLNDQKLDLHKGDMVAVEGNPGHDIGEVTLTGYLVHMQMKKTNYHFDDPEVTKKVYRHVTPADMEKYYEAKAREHDTMLRSRQIAEGLSLEMKIGDVEYQGDGQKAIFYYIADGRVDFRQLIKDLAAAFHIRIEMKQIGARQEAGRIGGTGPCGRELCCSTWLINFSSVGTGAVQCQVAHKVQQRWYGCRPFPGSLAQSAETCWPVRQAEVLPQLRSRLLYGICQGYSKQGHCLADPGFRLFLLQAGYSCQDGHLLNKQGRTVQSCHHPCIACFRGLWHEQAWT